MRVKFVEEIHYRVRLERRTADHDVFFGMRPVRRIRTAEFLSLHPGER